LPSNPRQTRPGQPGSDVPLSIEIRPIDALDREWAQDFLLAHSHSLRVVSRGVLHQADQLPGFIASLEGKPSALLTYRVASGELEVVTLHAAEKGKGLGSALLKAAKAEARELSCRRLWLITGRHKRLRCDGQSGPSSGG